MIASLLDQDLYKITMAYAVLKKYPGKHVKYRLINRAGGNFSPDVLKYLAEQVERIGDMDANPKEVVYLSEKLPFFDSWFVDWLFKFKPDPEHVTITPEAVTVEGPWERAIWWEVPILASVSQALGAGEWSDSEEELAGVIASTRRKVNKLDEAGCRFIEMGTRRRRSYRVQDRVVAVMKEMAADGYEAIMGTSNVHLACKYNLQPSGTMAHEWIMGVSATESLRFANRQALRAWNEVFKGELGIALTDTFGSDAFFRDFDGDLARRYSGVRQDSGDPYEFAEKLIEHYEKLNINPETKRCVFSDGLDVQTAVNLKRQFGGRISVMFGIGTHFTNDIPNKKAPNVVLKMVECDGVKVCKLSDVPGKASGDPNAVKMAKYVFLNEPIC